MRTAVEIACETGIPYQLIRDLDADTIATFIDVINERNK
jgi:hypothetical protein